MGTKGENMYDLDSFMAEVERKNPAQPEFIQAAREVVASVIDTVNSNPLYLKNKILDRIIEPDRIITFKVEWEDDNQSSESNVSMESKSTFIWAQSIVVLDTITSIYL